MRTLDNLVWIAMRGALWLCNLAYNAKVYGLEGVDKDRAAVFAVKHSSNLDFPVVVHRLPRRATTLATKGIFIHPATNYFLTVAGVVPINSPTDAKPKQNGVNAAAFRAFYKTLRQDGWVVYAPEATRVLGKVGKQIYPELLMKAAELGHNIYLVGVRYRNRQYPLLSCLRLPWQSGIEVRIEQYYARNKAAAQVAPEVREVFTRLSGLEQKVEASDSGAAASPQK